MAFHNEKLNEDRQRYLAYDLELYALVQMVKR